MTPKGLVATPDPDISDIAYVNGVAGRRVNPQPRPFVTSGNDIARAGGAGTRTCHRTRARRRLPRPEAARAAAGSISMVYDFKPPYGTMTAFDMKNGTIALQVPPRRNPGQRAEQPRPQGDEHPANRPVFRPQHADADHPAAWITAHTISTASTRAAPKASAASTSCPPALPITSARIGVSRLSQ